MESKIRRNNKAQIKKSDRVDISEVFRTSEKPIPTDWLITPSVVQMNLELFDVKALATLFCVSVRMVWQMRDAGKIPQPIKLGRLSRWRRSDIEKWVSEGCPPCRPAISRSSSVL